jgi:hypothetical protein
MEEGTGSGLNDPRSVRGDVHYGKIDNHGVATGHVYGDATIIG